MTRAELRRLAKGWAPSLDEVPHWELEHLARLVQIVWDQHGCPYLEITQAGRAYLEDLERKPRKRK